MVEFETIKAEEIKFGNNNFIEVARKKAIAEEGTNEFVAVSRGFFAPDGSKRFKKSFAIPDQPDVIDFVCEKLKEMAAVSGGSESATEEAPAEEPAEEAAPAEEATEEETEEKSE